MRGFGKISTGALVFLFFLSLYVLTMNGWIQYGVEIEKYRVAQSLVDRGQFSFRPTLSRNPVGVGDKNFSIYELGQSLAQIPFYILGKALNTFFPAPDVDWIPLLAVGLLNPLLSVLLCLLFFNFCKALGFRFNTGLALTLALGLSTVIWPYSKGFTREPLLTLLLLAATFAACLYAKTRSERWIVVMSLLAGLLVFTKFIQGIVVPVLFVCVLFVGVRHRQTLGASRIEIGRQIARSTLIFVTPVLLFLAAQMVYAFLRFGTPYGGIAGTQSEPISFIVSLLSLSQPLQALIGLLLSQEKSVFVYSPPVLLFAVAWWVWRRTRPYEAVLIGMLVLAEFVTVIPRYDWDGGSWWGPRYLVQITPLLLLPLGALLEYPGQMARRVWTGIFVALGIIGGCVSVVGAFTNDRDYADIYGQPSNLFGQIEFLKHGMIDTQVFNWAANGSLVVNPFAMLLVAVILLTGIALACQLRQGASVSISRRVSVSLVAFVLLVETLGFVMWIVAPYPQVLAARADTRYVAANDFLAQGKRCEAVQLYLMALARETTFQTQTAVRLEELMPRALGKEISIRNQSLWTNVSPDASVEEDYRLHVQDAASLRFSAPAGNDVMASITSEPVGVLPNRNYELSGWVRGNGLYGSGYAVVAVFEDNGDWGNGRTTDVVAVQETVGWQPFRTKVSALATSHRMFVNMGLYNTYGTFWLDGLKLIEVDPKLPQPAAIELPCK